MFCFTPSNSINDKFKSYLKGHCKDKSKQSVKCKSNVKWLWNTLYWRLYWFTVDNFDLLSVFLHGGADHLIMIFSFLWDFWVSVLYTVIMMIIPYGRNESPPHHTHPPPLRITQLINSKSNFLTLSKRSFWKMVYPPTHFGGSGAGRGSKKGGKFHVISCPFR